MENENFCYNPSTIWVMSHNKSDIIGTLRDAKKIVMIPKP